MGYKMVYIKETRMFKAEKEGGIHATLRGVKEKGESFGVLPSGSPLYILLGIIPVFQSFITDIYSYRNQSCICILNKTLQPRIS